MKRFVDLRASEAGPSFAFFCTIRDVFEEFSGSQAWTSIEDFKIDFEADGVASELSPLERYLSLIEAWVPEKNEP